MPTQTKQVSRRDSFKWLGLAGTAVALDSAWRMPLAMAEEQQKAVIERMTGAGFYPTKIGDLYVTLVNDGLFTFPQPHPLFGSNTTKEAVEMSLYENFVPYDQVIGHVNTLLIKAGRDVILIDTGCANAFGPSCGHQLKNLSRAGVEPGDITHVVLTHLHGDHTGGLIDADAKLTFPKAKIIMHDAEAAFWGQDVPDLSKSDIPAEMKTAFAAGAKKILTAAKPKLELIKGDRTDLAPGVTAVLAAGHTPGHLIFDLESRGEKMTYITDLSHQVSVTFPHPDWLVAFDTDQKAGAAARQSYYDRLASGRTRIAGSHLPFPGFGHVRKLGENGYQYVPEEWRW